MTLWVPGKHAVVSLRWKPFSNTMNVALLVEHLLETVNLDNPVSKNISNKMSLRGGHMCLLMFLYKKPSPQTLSIYITPSNRSLNWVNSYFNSHYSDWEVPPSIVHIRSVKISVNNRKRIFKYLRIRIFLTAIPSHNSPVTSYFCKRFLAQGTRKQYIPLVWNCKLYKLFLLKSLFTCNQ